MDTNWLTAWIIIANLILVIVLTRQNQMHKKVESTLSELRELKSFTQGVNTKR
jgi:hypothetical protein